VEELLDGVRLGDCAWRGLLNEAHHGFLRQRHGTQAMEFYRPHAGARNIRCSSRQRRTTRTWALEKELGVT